MFKIYDGRDTFYQWDLDRKLIVYDETIKEVHFCNRADDNSLVCEVYKDGNLNLVNVPNILLQDNWRINVYAYDETYTKHSQRFDVKSRTKPADYVYTETEVKNWDDLAERISALEKNSGTGESGKQEVFRVNITTDENGEYKADKTYLEVATAYTEGMAVHCLIELNGSVFILPLCNYNLEQLYLVYGGSAANASIAVIQTITGNINIINQTLATNDDIENAIAKLPTGTPQQMELIASGTNTEPVRRFRINVDNDGNAFELTKAFFRVSNFYDNAGGGGNLGCHITLGGEVIVGAMMPTTSDDTKNKMAIAYADTNGVMWTAQGGGGIYHRGAVTADTSFPVGQTITQAEFTTADVGKNLAPGATYELWGVRK